MVCFWIGLNTESTACSFSPSRRLLLELVSFIIQVVVWIITLTGLILIGDSGFQELSVGLNYLTGNRSPLGGDKFTSSSIQPSEVSVNRALAASVFLVGNLSYLLATLVLACLSLYYRRAFISLANRPQPQATGYMKREQLETCTAICTPCNGLRIFHHLEQRGGFLTNLVVLVLCLIVLSSGTSVPGALWLSVPLCLLCCIQMVLACIYTEDVALCGVGACCVYLLWVRRSPPPYQEEIGMA